MHARVNLLVKSTIWGCGTYARVVCQLRCIPRFDVFPYSPPSTTCTTEATTDDFENPAPVDLCVCEMRDLRVPPVSGGARRGCTP